MCDNQASSFVTVKVFQINVSRNSRWQSEANVVEKGEGKIMVMMGGGNGRKGSCTN